MIPLALDTRTPVVRWNRRAALRRLLADGRWHTSTELARVGGRRYGARVQELRDGGDGLPALVIACERIAGMDGEYRWRAEEEHAAGENIATREGACPF